MKATAWVAIAAASLLLAVDTLRTIFDVGLFGERPPLSTPQTVLRLALIIAALALFVVRRHPLERTALALSVAAAGSSFLYGMGMRSPALAAFRLLSHLAMYALVAIASGRLARTSTRGTPPQAH